MNPDWVITEVARKMKVGKKQILGQTRKREVTDARMVICYILRKQGMTFAQIGEVTKRHYSSTLYLAQRMDNFINDKKLRAAKVCREMLGLPDPEPKPKPIPAEDKTKERKGTWSGKERAYLARMWMGTETADSIASVLGRSPSAVTDMAYTMLHTGDIQMTHKQCKGCRKVLPISEYWLSDRNPDGRQNYCKECQKQMVAYPKRACRQCENYPCFAGIENLESDFAKEGCHGYHKKAVKPLNKAM